MTRALAFLTRDLRTELSYRFSFLMQFIQVLAGVFIFFFISRLLGPAVAPGLAAYGGDYFAFVIIGIALSSYFGVGLASFAQSLRDAQTTGTLEAMLMTPTRVSTIILGSALWTYAFTTLRVLLYLGVGALLGMSLARANLGLALLTLILSIVTFSAIGILAASFIMVLKRGDPVTGVVGVGATLIAGVYYPTEILPPALQALAQLVPITYSLRALRLSLLQGASWQEIAFDVTALAAFALILLPLSLYAFRLAVNRARVDGSLTHY
jgi:ABC-2 type transport system permease protein